MMGNPNNTDSKHIMHLIKEGSVGAEIGVWMGSSSRQFVKRNPKKFYMIDPWSVSGYQESISAKDFDENRYYTRYSELAGGSDENSFNKKYDEVAEQVIEEFGNYKNVEICRMNSSEWFAQFNGPFLDWIYIDGDHSYTGVYRDFSNALKLVKTGGIIIGDDYKWGREGDKGGVKKAVNQWATENFLTLEKYGQNQVVVRV